MVELLTAKSPDSALRLIAAVDILTFFTSRMLTAGRRSPLLSTFATLDDLDDTIVPSLQRVGLVFLLLGLVRASACRFPRDKGAAILSLWSWVVEFAYIRFEVQRQRANGSLFAPVATLAAVMFVIIAFMLGWSYQNYRTKFYKGAPPSAAAP